MWACCMLHIFNTQQTLLAQARTSVVKENQTYSLNNEKVDVYLKYKIHEDMKRQLLL